MAVRACLVSQDRPLDSSPNTRAGYCPTPVIPAAGPDGTLFLSLEARIPRSVEASSRSGRPAGPTRLACRTQAPGLRVAGQSPSARRNDVRSGRRARGWRQVLPKASWRSRRTAPCATPRPSSIRSGGSLVEGHRARTLVGGPPGGVRQRGSVAVAVAVRVTPPSIAVTHSSAHPTRRTADRSTTR